MDINVILRLIKEGESEKVEFKKQATKDIYKEICAFANTDGGFLLVGIDDKGNIVGCDVKKNMEVITSSVQSIMPPPKIKTKKARLDDKNILVVEIAKSDVLCSVGGVAYIRIGSGIRPLSIQEILMLSSEFGTVSWDEIPTIDLDKINKDYVSWFFKTMESVRGKSTPRNMWFKYLRSIKAIKGNKLTNAGILFFTDANEFINHSKCKIIFVEDEPKSSKEYEGPIWKVIDDVIKEIIRETSKMEVVVGVKRIKVEEYPLRALREAIINAFAHRNYAIPSEIKVFIHPDKIVIRNPGGLMPGVDLNEPEHIPRNPVICQLLYDAGFIEKYGYGIITIRKECEKHPFVNVEFKTAPNKFEVIFKKDMTKLIDETDEKILALLITPKKSSEIAKEIGLSKPTIIERLKRLEKLKLIKKEGKGPRIRYRVV